MTSFSEATINVNDRGKKGSKGDIRDDLGGTIVKGITRRL